jgi:hypothetical protein
MIDVASGINYDTQSGAGTVVSSFYVNRLGVQTIDAINGQAGDEVTYTNAATLRIDGPPAAGRDKSVITNAHSLHVATGNSYFGGSVGIGTTNPSYNLDVTGTIRASTVIYANSRFDTHTTSQRVKYSVYPGTTYGMGMGSSYTFGGLSDYAISFQMSNHSGRGWWWGDDSHTNAQGAMSLTTTGLLNVAGFTRIGYGESSTTAPVTYALDVSGTIRATGNVIAYSDARVKDNVETIEGALSKVNKLRGVSYTRNDIEDKSRQLGVIAQEVMDVLPEVVEKDDDGRHSVAYGNIVGVLIEAIKEQDKKMEKLEALVELMLKNK